jgi:hypothetical protein
MHLIKYLVSVSTRKPTIITEVIHGFPQSLLINTKTIPSNRPLLFFVVIVYVVVVVIIIIIINSSCSSAYN